MPVDLDALIHDTLQLNAAHAAISDTSSIVFDETYRKYCEQNRCGQYDTNWMGPPAIGPISELKERVLKYKQGLLFQTIYTYQGTGLFDYKGMKEGMKVHEQIFRKILAMMKTRYSFKAVFPLNAGCCTICPGCAYLDNRKPCRNPDLAVASVEAYGIDVMKMEVDAGIPYYNGKGTYSFVGLILFQE
jgi:predicted metal-binding protein